MPSFYVFEKKKKKWMQKYPPLVQIIEKSGPFNTQIVEKTR